METNLIATKADIAQAKAEIIAFIKQTLSESDIKTSSTQTKEYLRSRDVKAMLGVSDNKLKDMRIKGEIPFIKKGDTYFYPTKEFQKSMGDRSQP